MNTTRITFALIVAGLLALAAVVANVRTPVGVDTVIGFGAVIALIAVAVIDYRLPVRRVLGLR
jgi:hypothetical protein